MIRSPSQKSSFDLVANTKELVANLATRPAALMETGLYIASFASLGINY